MNPVCVSTWVEGGCKYFDSFIKTCEKHSINPKNADETVWPPSTVPAIRDLEWFRKSMAQAQFVRDHEKEYSHFMFVDAYDVVFAAGWPEIMEKFQSYNTPILFGAECCCWPPDPELCARYPQTNRRCKYLNAGFWMGETWAIAPLVEELDMLSMKKEKCDQAILRDLFLSGRHPAKLDTECKILMCCNLDSHDFIEMKLGRWTNTETGQSPCLFHGNGASDLSRLIPALL